MILTGYQYPYMQHALPAHPYGKFAEARAELLQCLVPPGAEAERSPPAAQTPANELTKHSPRTLQPCIASPPHAKVQTVPVPAEKTFHEFTMRKTTVIPMPPVVHPAGHGRERNIKPSIAKSKS